MKNIKSGFTLIELSVVLTIIFIMLAGLGLYKQISYDGKVENLFYKLEDLRRKTIEFQKENDFLPGDATLNSVYFAIPTSEDQADYLSRVNGDNNGLVEGDEAYYFWHHLHAVYNIGINFNLNTNGSITKGDNIINGDSRDVASLVPSADNFNAYLHFQYINNNPVISIYRNGSNATGVFTTEDLLTFDKIYDDGNPSTGKIFTNSNCINNNKYNLSYKNDNCVMHFTIFENNNLQINNTSLKHGYSSGGSRKGYYGIPSSIIMDGRAYLDKRYMVKKRCPYNLIEGEEIVFDYNNNFLGGLKAICIGGDLIYRKLQQHKYSGYACTSNKNITLDTVYESDYVLNCLGLYSNYTHTIENQALNYDYSDVSISSGEHMSNKVSINDINKTFKNTELVVKNAKYNISFGNDISCTSGSTKDFYCSKKDANVTLTCKNNQFSKHEFEDLCGYNNECSKSLMGTVKKSSLPCPSGTNDRMEICTQVDDHFIWKQLNNSCYDTTDKCSFVNDNKLRYQWQDTISGKQFNSCKRSNGYIYKLNERPYKQCFRGSSVYNKNSCKVRNSSLQKKITANKNSINLYKNQDRSMGPGKALFSNGDIIVAQYNNAGVNILNHNNHHALNSISDINIILKVNYNGTVNNILCQDSTPVIQNHKKDKLLIQGKEFYFKNNQFVILSIINNGYYLNGFYIGAINKIIISSTTAIGCNNFQGIIKESDGYREEITQSEAYRNTINAKLFDLNNN